MALRNGLLVHGPTHWAAAVRAPAGEVKVASGPKPDVAGSLAERVPGVRGLAKVADALAVVPVVKRELPEAELPMQDLRTLGTMLGAALAGQGIRRDRGAHARPRGGGRHDQPGPGAAGAPRR